MKVLVTGASGFVGKNVLLSLANRWEMTGVYNRTKDFPEWLKRHKLTSVRPVRCDLADREATAKALPETYDAVLHLAASSDPAVSVTHPDADLLENTLATIHLLQNVSCRRFVYLSSGAVYEGHRGEVHPGIAIHPTLGYAISKFAAERYVEAIRKGQENLIVRFFGAFGPYEPARKIYTKLVRNFGMEKKSEFVIRGDGKNRIDALYITDAVDVIRQMVEEKIIFPTIDVGYGKGWTITELVREAAAAFGIEKPVIRYEGEVPECNQFWMSTDQLKKAYDFKPQVDLKTGLLRLCEHLKKVPQ